MDYMIGAALIVIAFFNFYQIILLDEISNRLYRPDEGDES